MGTEPTGAVEIPRGTELIVSVAIAAELLDWTAPVNAVGWLAMGKKQVWFDYLALLEQGRNGAWLEERLKRMHVTIYAKQVLADEVGGLVAYVVVDKSRVPVVEGMLAKMGV